jgi:hypothetical protein
VEVLSKADLEKIADELRALHTTFHQNWTERAARVSVRTRHSRLVRSTDNSGELNPMTPESKDPEEADWLPDARKRVMNIIESEFSSDDRRSENLSGSSA